MTATTPRGLIVAAFIAAAGQLAAPARAQSDFPSAISVTGEATISVPPDLAQVDAGVASDAKTAREASEVNNAAMAKVLSALKAAGVAEKDYQTSRLSLQPQYPPNRSGPAPTVGYHANNRVTIRLRDINFMVSQASKLLDDARTQAIADARRKAEIYAKAAGVTLGEPLSISEGGSPGPLFRSKMAAPMAIAPVAQGEETLSVAVNVSWAIKQGQ